MQQTEALNGLDDRLRDIQAISFTDHIREITASMTVVLTLYHMDDDPRIIGACKDKLAEGIAKLETIAHTAQTAAKEYKSEYK